MTTRNDRHLTHGRPASTGSTTARSTPSWSRSPTCRAGCRASACTGATSLDVVARARHRGLQLPARRRRRHEHRRRLRDLLVGARLRRHGVRARLATPSGCSPTCPATAMVQCDLVWLDHAPVLQSPRTILQAPARPGAPSRAGRRWPAPSSSSSRSTRRTRTAHDRGYRDLTPVNQYNVDYSILGTTPGRAAAARHPQPHVRRRAGRRGRQGRVQLRPARDRLPLRRRADHRRQPRASTRPRPRRSPPSRASRSRSWRSTTSARATPATSTCRCAATTATLVFWDGDGARTPLYDHFIAGVLATHARTSRCSTRRTSTPTSGSRPARSRRPTIAWGLDNRTCAVRLVGHGAERPDGEPGARRRREPLPRARRDAGRRPARHRERAGARGRAGRQRLRPPTSRRCRTRCATPASVFAALASSPGRPSATRSSTTTSNMADVELAAFDAAVTDWELAPRLRAAVSD